MHRFLAFPSRDDAVEAAAGFAASVLNPALETWSGAHFFVSGGTTPAPVFRLLSQMPLDWARVTVGLVDERWVDSGHEASNERLVRETLLTNYAGAAGFIPMKTAHVQAADAVQDRQLAYAPHTRAADLVFLGMGPDKHTASWFPGSDGLADAMHSHDLAAIAAIDATGCPVAGKYPERMTLTGSAITRARSAMLLMFGDDKRIAFESALKQPVLDAPIRCAVDGLGKRLSVFWAP
jgi:6-phosphogluconolactonase